MSQLKLKTAEAKELTSTVIESDTYKKTLESLKPAPSKKEEKSAVAEPATAAPTATEEAAAPAAEAAAAKVPVETAKDDAKKDEPKRRSASRKRASVFGSIFSANKKDDEKKTAEPSKEEDKAVVAEPATAVPVATQEAPAPVTEAASAETPVEAVKDEDKKEEAPKPVKRQRYECHRSELGFVSLMSTQHLRQLVVQPEEGRGG